MKLKTVFLEPLGVSREKLVSDVNNALGDVIDPIFCPDRKEDEASLIARAKDAEIAVLSNIPFKKAVIENCPDLKMICVAFTGTDHVDVDFCRQRGITVCNCAGYSTSAVADLVFGLLISIMRSIPACDKAARTGGTKAGLIGDELEGKTFGIIGTGAIGTRVAAIASAFGCRVMAYSRTVKNIEGVTYASLEDVLRKSDILSIHVPQNASTVGMISERELSLMKPSAILINTARGPIVDEKALENALKDGRLRAAGLDVFSKEPPLSGDMPLLSAPNLLLTPHVGFASNQAFEKRLKIVIENIKAYINGQPINLV